MTAPGAEPAAAPLPRAALAPASRIRWAWLLPLGAAALAAVLGVQAWRGRGTTVAVRFLDGRGIKPGDALRHRGIAVGEVRAVGLEPDLAAVRVEVLLQRGSEPLAARGSRFWIVRPEVGLYRVRGLETVIGARYLAVLPGEGPPERTFQGLEEPPVVEDVSARGLQVVLEGPRGGSLVEGAPVSYRGVRVGTLLSVGLAGDATEVEVRAYIGSEYAPLVRENTRFWNASGLDLDLGLVRGLTLDVQSLQTILAGGVGFATPTAPGPPAANGQRFTLHERPEKAWMEWRPVLPLGHLTLPEGATLPRPVPVTLRWKEGRLWPRERSRAGWALRVEDGLLGPADLLEIPGDAREGSAELAGPELSLPLSGPPARSGEGLVVRVLEAAPASLPPPWPASRIREAAAPEDCFVVGDPGQAPHPLRANRLRPREGAWEIAAEAGLGPGWHGAAVIARSDARLIGVLVREGALARVAPIPRRPER